jgi:hypothetical protein
MGTTLTNLSLQLPDGGIKDVDINSAAGIKPSKLEQQATQVFDIPLTDARVWDDFRALVPSTAANDDLGLITGTWGTDTPTLQSGDGKATTITRRAGFAFRVPHNFVSAGTLVIRVRGGMVTTISDDVASVDLEVYEADLDGGVGSDLCQTSAVSVNSLTKVNADFTIDSSGLVAGDLLYLRLTAAITDAATGTAVIVEVSDINARLTTQG